MVSSSISFPSLFYGLSVDRKDTGHIASVEELLQSFPNPSIVDPDGYNLFHLCFSHLSKEETDFIQNPISNLGSFTTKCSKKPDITELLSKFSASVPEFRRDHLLSGTRKSISWKSVRPTASRLFADVKSPSTTPTKSPKKSPMTRINNKPSKNSPDMAKSPKITFVNSSDRWKTPKGERKSPKADRWKSPADRWKSPKPDRGKSPKVIQKGNSPEHFKSPKNDRKSPKTPVGLSTFKTPKSSTPIPTQFRLPSQKSKKASKTRSEAIVSFGPSGRKENRTPSSTPSPPIENSIITKSSAALTIHLLYTLSFSSMKDVYEGIKAPHPDLKEPPLHTIVRLGSLIFFDQVEGCPFDLQMYFDVLIRFIEAGLDDLPNILNQDGQHILHITAHLFNIQVTSLVVDSFGENVDSCDPSGHTSLELASQLSEEKSNQAFDDNCLILGQFVSRSLYKQKKIPRALRQLVAGKATSSFRLPEKLKQFGDTIIQNPPLDIYRPPITLRCSNHFLGRLESEIDLEKGSVIDVLFSLRVETEGYCVFLRRLDGRIGPAPDTILGFHCGVDDEPRPQWYHETVSRYNYVEECRLLDDISAAQSDSALLCKLESLLSAMLHPDGGDLRHSFILMYRQYLSSEDFMNSIILRFCFGAFSANFCQSVLSLMTEWRRDYWREDWVWNSCLQDQFSLLGAISQVFGIEDGSFTSYAEEYEPPNETETDRFGENELVYFRVEQPGNYFRILVTPEMTCRRMIELLELKLQTKPISIISRKRASSSECIAFSPIQRSPLNPDSPFLVHSPLTYALSSLSPFSPVVTHSPAIISCSPIHLSSQSPVSMDRISPEANLMSPSLSPDLANIVSPNLLGGDALNESSEDEFYIVGLTPNETPEEPEDAEDDDALYIVGLKDENDESEASDDMYIVGVAEENSSSGDEILIVGVVGSSLEGGTPQGERRAMMETGGRSAEELKKVKTKIKKKNSADGGGKGSSILRRKTFTSRRSSVSGKEFSVRDGIPIAKGRAYGCIDDDAVSHSSSPGEMLLAHKMLQQASYNSSPASEHIQPPKVIPPMSSVDPLRIFSSLFDDDILLVTPSQSLLGFVERTEYHSPPTPRPSNSTALRIPSTIKLPLCSAPKSLPSLHSPSSEVSDIPSPSSDPNLTTSLISRESISFSNQKRPSSQKISPPSIISSPLLTLPTDNPTALPLSLSESPLQKTTFPSSSLTNSSLLHTSTSFSRGPSPLPTPSPALSPSLSPPLSPASFYPSPALPSSSSSSFSNRTSTPPPSPSSHESSLSYQPTRSLTPTSFLGAPTSSASPLSTKSVSALSHSSRPSPSRAYKSSPYQKHSPRHSPRSSRHSPRSSRHSPRSSPSRSRSPGSSPRTPSRRISPQLSRPLSPSLYSPAPSSPSPSSPSSPSPTPSLPPTSPSPSSPSPSSPSPSPSSPSPPRNSKPHHRITPPPHPSTVDIRSRRFSATPKTIASQLSLYEHLLYSAVTSVQFLKWNFAKNKKEECPVLFSLISHFNSVAKWSTWNVVSRVKQNHRRKSIKKIISICKECLELKNFFGLRALLSGLSHHAINRMKATLSSLDEKSVRDWESMKELMSHRANYQSYRQRVTTTEAPYIPFVACDIKDMLFLCDGNQDVGDLVNITKMMKAAEYSFLFRRGAEATYSFRPEMALDEWSLQEFEKLTDKELDWWSHTCEPPNQDYEAVIAELLSLNEDSEHLLNEIQHLQLTEQHSLMAQYKQQVSGLISTREKLLERISVQKGDDGNDGDGEGLNLSSQFSGQKGKKKRKKEKKNKHKKSEK